MKPILAVLVLVFSAVRVIAAPVARPHISVELIADSASLAPGKPVRLGVRFRPEPGWHVYWRNPGDSGEPPRINWRLPENLRAGDLRWPAPQRIAFGPLTNFGYENDVLLFATADVTGKPAANTTLRADVSWLVCREECIPGKAELSLALPSGDGSPSADFERFEAAARAVPIAFDGAAILTGTDPPTIAIEADVAPLDFFPHEEGILDNSTPPRIRSDGRSHEMVLTKTTAAPIERLSGVIRFTDGKTLSVELGASRSESLLAMLAFALLGGMLLNLMPCVFPVLSIKVLGFVESAKHDGRGALGHGISYLFGILVSFWALVAVLVLLRAGGAQIGWGFQLQSPVFLAVLGFLFVAIALNLLGAFEIGSRWAGIGGQWTNRGGLGGSFFTGILATLVATPCTAPFMGAAIGFALSQSGPIIFLVFTALGLGMALPYVVLAASPSLVRFLPRPGAWMEGFRQLMALPILLTVAWMISVIGRQTGMHQVFLLLTGLLTFAFGIHFLGRSRDRKAAIAAAATLCLAGVAVAVWGLRSGATPAAGAAEGPWKPFSEARLAETRASGNPVFVDFTASWCITCQVNEQLVLDTPEVQAKFREKGVELIQADWTNQNAEISRRLESFGRSGVPLYVLYPPGADSKPAILPQILTKDLMLNTLDAFPSRPANQGAPQ